MSVKMNVCIKQAVYGPGPYEPAVYEEQVVSTGMVLVVESNTYQVMSDVWETGTRAIVWNAQERKPEYLDWIIEGTVDATPEVVQAYKEFLIRKRFNELERKALADAEVIVKGDTVQVVKGRAGKGASGKVVVNMNAYYRAGYSGYTAQKLAIATSDVMVEKVMPNGKVFQNYRDMIWVWAMNCKKINQVQIDFAALGQDAVKAVEYAFSKNAQYGYPRPSSF